MEIKKINLEKEMPNIYSGIASILQIFNTVSGKNILESGTVIVKNNKMEPICNVDCVDLGIVKTESNFKTECEDLSDCESNMLSKESFYSDISKIDCSLNCRNQSINNSFTNITTVSGGCEQSNGIILDNSLNDDDSDTKPLIISVSSSTQNVSLKSDILVNGNNLLHEIDSKSHCNLSYNLNTGNLFINEPTAIDSHKYHNPNFGSIKCPAENHGEELTEIPGTSLIQKTSLNDKMARENIQSFHNEKSINETEKLIRLRQNIYKTVDKNQGCPIDPDLDSDSSVVDSSGIEDDTDTKENIILYKEIELPNDDVSSENSVFENNDNLKFRTNKGDSETFVEADNKQRNPLNNGLVSSKPKKGRGRPRVLIKKTHPCSICHKVFTRKTHLTTHLRIHSDEKPFTCNLCYKNFRDNSVLIKHIRVHTQDKPYVCPYCQKAFNQKGNMERHARQHTNEKPFACNICGNAFSNKSHLQRHFRIHIDEKPFMCALCEKSFRQKSHLIRHVLVHSREKPYECNLCHKKFRQEQHVTRHKTTHIKEVITGFLLNHCISNPVLADRHKTAITSST